MAKQARMLAGRTVAITGAARGIGLATAQALAREGMRVALGDIDRAAVESAAAALGPTAVGLPLDVTDRDSFVGFLDGAEQQLGPLDVLVNNAGIMQLGRFIDEDDLTARRMVDINLHGVILGTKLALARMLPRDSGHIVNISSQAGKYGAPGGATYAATKHAVVGLSEAVRAELQLMKANIDISYVLPFAVDTELGSGLGNARGMRKLKPAHVAEAIVEALKLGIVDVYVPKSGKRTILLGELLPRSISERATRIMKVDQVLAGADAAVRKDYELRAARSAPALEAGADPRASAPAADQKASSQAAGPQQAAKDERHD